MPIHVTLSEDAMPQSPTIMITQSGNSDVWVNLLGIPTTAGPSVVRLLRAVADGIDEMMVRGVIPGEGEGAHGVHTDEENAPAPEISPEEVAEQRANAARKDLLAERAKPRPPKFAPR